MGERHIVNAKRTFVNNLREIVIEQKQTANIEKNYVTVGLRQNVIVLLFV